MDVTRVAPDLLLREEEQFEDSEVCGKTEAGLVHLHSLTLVSRTC